VCLLLCSTQRLGDLDNLDLEADARRGIEPDEPAGVVVAWRGGTPLSSGWQTDHEDVTLLHDRGFASP
jgi:hypothetical protein